MRIAINNGILLTQFTDDFVQQYNYQVLEVHYNDVQYSDFDCQNGNFIFDIQKYNQRKQIDYERLVDSKIRTKYTLSQELAILRQRDIKPSEYQEYYAYCEQCKTEAKQEVGV